LNDLVVGGPAAARLPDQPRDVEAAEEAATAIVLTLSAQACGGSLCARPERYVLEPPLRIDAEAGDESRHEAVFEGLREE